MNKDNETSKTKSAKKRNNSLNKKKFIEIHTHWKYLYFNETGKMQKSGKICT